MRVRFPSLSKPIAALISCASIGIATLLLFSVRSYINTTEVAFAYVLVVLISATLFGSTPALLASICGILCLNFFFLPPYYTFTISDPENWITYGAFIITAILVG